MPGMPGMPQNNAAKMYLLACPGLASQACRACTNCKVLNDATTLIIIIHSFCCYLFHLYSALFQIIDLYIMRANPVYYLCHGSKSGTYKNHFLFFLHN